MRKRYFTKSIVLFLLILFSLLTGAYADDESSNTNNDIVEATSSPFDLSELTIDELLDLRVYLDEEILNRGYIAYYDLQRGDKGDDVVKLQERLKELNYYSGLISGKYDTETQKAMKLFEKTNGLTNDGIASREDQTVLFSHNAIAKEVEIRTQATEKTPTPTIDPRFEDYGQFDYEDCSRYPENHIGEKVVLKGKVVQVLGSRKRGFTVRLSIMGSLDDIVYLSINNDPGFNILENDRLTVYAKITGTKTYTAVFGNSVTIPSATADYIELRK